jgi:hypothetical protein
MNADQAIRAAVSFAEEAGVRLGSLDDIVFMPRKLDARNEPSREGDWLVIFHVVEEPDCVSSPSSIWIDVDGISGEATWREHL